MQIVANWVANPNNPYFARAQANRVWFHLMGRGLVEPNDDFRVSNPAINEPLLDDLAKRFTDYKFDLRALVRLVMENGKVVKEERYLHGLKERIRDVQQGPDGYIYVITDNTNGRILRVLPK